MKKSIKNDLNFIVSYFGLGSLTPAKVDICEALTVGHRISKDELIVMLSSKGYSRKIIEKELDLCCYSSKMRFIAEEGSYEPIQIGVDAWTDLKSKAPFQKSCVSFDFVVSGNFHNINVTIPCSSFLSSHSKLYLREIGFRYTPLTYTCSIPIEQIPEVVTNLASNLQIATGKTQLSSAELKRMIRSYGKTVGSSVRAWFLGKIVVPLRTSPISVQLLRYLFRHGRRPIEWKGGQPVSVESILSYLRREQVEIYDCINHLTQFGIFREIGEHELTFTALGYSAWRYYEKAEKGFRNFDVLLLRKTADTYDLEVANSSFIHPDVKNVILRNCDSSGLYDSLHLKGLSRIEVQEMLTNALYRLKP